MYWLEVITEKRMKAKQKKIDLEDLFFFYLNSNLIF